MLSFGFSLLSAVFLLSSLFVPLIAVANDTTEPSYNICHTPEGTLTGRLLLETGDHYEGICPSERTDPSSSANGEGALILSASLAAPSATLASPSSNDNEFINSSALDKFGVVEIYPTKENGREWYMNTSDPRSDKDFVADGRIKKQPNGAWRISGEDLRGNHKGQVRIEINTSKNEEQWKNVEITGYVRVVQTTGSNSSTSSSLENVFQWYARGGRHDEGAPCDGTSLKGRLHLNGKVSWVKEIWHSGGYTKEKSRDKATPHLVKEQDSQGNFRDGRWVGFKVVIYNIDNDKAVRMEAFLDERLDNKWIKVNSLEDRGQWYSDSKKFNDVDCGRPRNYIVTNSGPMVGFRTDDIIWEFKDLSVREIDPFKK
jgi:hypothetical protein